MKLFRRQHPTQLDAQEQRLNAISELTRGLGKTEFNNLMDAVQSVFEARQKLLRVKTKEEKASKEIDKAEVAFLEGEE